MPSNSFCFFKKAQYVIDRDIFCDKCLPNKVERRAIFRVKKICTCCGLERDAERDFNWEYKARGIRQKRCKCCQAELSKLHYKNNKQIYNERASIHKTQILIENKPRLYAYLSKHPCVDCGQTDMRLLEFDHVYGQKFREVGDLLREGFNWSTIEAEIAKCEIRCANCHRAKTCEKGGSWRHFFSSITDRLCPDPTRSLEAMRKARITVENKQKLYTYLSKHVCVDCGQTDMRFLEFDHVRSNKLNSISVMINNGSSWSTIEAEIAKCDVRCANCHRIKTCERDGDWWRARISKQLQGGEQCAD